MVTMRRFPMAAHDHHVCDGYDIIISSTRWICFKRCCVWTAFAFFEIYIGDCCRLNRRGAHKKRQEHMERYRRKFFPCCTTKAFRAQLLMWWYIDILISLWKKRKLLQELRMESVSLDMYYIFMFTWPVEWATCNFFWISYYFRQGWMLVTLRNKKNIGLLYFMFVSSSYFWLLYRTTTTWWPKKTKSL